jgi:D-sedoheptulose 7-phosphate isomerase
MGDLCDHLVAVPSDDTQRIQEIHIAAGHAICEIVESELFGQ